MLFVATVASWNVNIVVVIMMSQPPRACPDPGKGPNTSSQMCPVQIKPWSSLINQFGASRVTYGSKRPFLAIFGHFGGLWRPPGACPDPGKGPNTSSQMCPGQIKPWSSLINQFGASREPDGHNCNFGPFLAVFWPKMGQNDLINFGCRLITT